MPTLPADRLAELRTGDRICAINGYPKDYLVVGRTADGGIRLANPLQHHEWVLYEVQASITYRR